MRQIVVLGSGLAAIRAATLLERRLESRRHVNLTLITDTTRFTYRPLLPHVVSGQLEISAISCEFDDLLLPSTDLVVTDIDEIDPTRRVIISENKKIPFEYLILAPSPAPDWQGHSEYEAFAQPFETPDDAAAIRDWGTTSAVPDHFVIVGAGPNAIELTGHLDATLDADFTLIDTSQTPLPAVPAELRRACWSYLREREIEFIGGTSFESVDLPGHDSKTSSTSGAKHAILWCAGTRPPPFLQRSKLPTDHMGRIPVDETLAVEQNAGIYAVGIAATAPAKWPSTTHSLRKQGQTAAQNLLASLSGRTPISPGINEPSWTISLGPDVATVYRDGAVVSGRTGATLHRLLHASLIPDAGQKIALLETWLQFPGDSSWLF